MPDKAARKRGKKPVAGQPSASGWDCVRGRWLVHSVPLKLARVQHQNLLYDIFRAKLMCCFIFKHKNHIICGEMGTEETDLPRCLCLPHTIFRASLSWILTKLWVVIKYVSSLFTGIYRLVLLFHLTCIYVLLYSLMQSTARNLELFSQ